MPEIIFLGTANAISDDNHDNTHFALLLEKRTFLIDCGSNPIVRLRRAGIPWDTVTDIILTHFHPDHVSGFPIFLMDMWLKGRKRPLKVYGLTYTLDCMEKLMDFYEWHSWPNFFEVEFVRLPENHQQVALDDVDVKISTIPTQHLIPSMALRFELPQKTITYSSDTQPCDAVITLAAGSDILIHECSGAHPGHSSAAQAGEAAQKAGAGALYLIHYPVNASQAELINEARLMFNGSVELAQDFNRILL